MPKAGKQATTGDFLLSGNQDDSDFHKWNAEDYGVSGVLLEESGRWQNKQQALICNARRLLNTMYGMLKNHTEYREPEE